VAEVESSLTAVRPGAGDLGLASSLQKSPSSWTGRHVAGFAEQTNKGIDDYHTQWIACSYHGWPDRLSSRKDFGSKFDVDCGYEYLRVHGFGRVRGHRKKHSSNTTKLAAREKNCLNQQIASALICLIECNTSLLRSAKPERVGGRNRRMLFFNLLDVRF
jgi:hypothetical protein